MMLKIFVILAITENFQACMYCLVLVCKTKTLLKLNKNDKQLWKEEKEKKTTVA
jgi:hypothetical protein